MRITLTLLFLSCAVPVAAQVAVSTPTPTVEQAYRPVNQRDPLVPATTYGDQKGTAAKPREKGGAAAAPAVEKGTATIFGLTLTGIMEDSRGRQALMRDASGAVYLLRAGLLTDAKKKPVRGVSGVVKGKQVILMTDDKQVRHLNLRENE